ncbi:MAG: O-acetylhomoserine aminocarboxypropyltransferase/cysteine synthase family protein [Victivallaceae bacterium]|nr:O-acetylhomoserine aminocarboxypropyltransferase/cysteine synthase family protein [Victivallaceae bacterium]
MDENWKFETRAIQCGYNPTQNSDPRILPIVQSTTYKYNDAQSVADWFDLKAPGHIYTRLTNPTVSAFEAKMAALEGGVGAIATSSGQAANMLAILNVATSGSHVVCVSAIYGGTFNLFKHTLKKMNVDFTFVVPDSTPEEIEAAVRPNTRAIFGETLANPALNVLDLERFAEVAHRHGLPFIVDNTFPTPYLCNPFKFGADIVTHSTTKYLDGHATSVGGVIVEKGDFDWKNGKFPEFTEPDESYHGLIYTREFAAHPFSAKLTAQWIRDLGVPMAPFNAFLTNLGTETLHVRMDRHCSNALALARHLKSHPKVGWVNYPFLEDSPEYERARKYLRGGSGVLSFGIKGGAKAGETVMNALKLAAIVVHVADVRTCVLHPASMTHRQLSDAELIAAGVPSDLVRVSVGIENVEDIIADFDQALAKA